MINLNLFKNVPPNIKVKLATSQSELEQAYQLTYKEYLKQNLITEHVSELAVFEYNLLPQTSVIVAKIEDKVIGTATLINGNSFMLPIFHDQNRALNHIGQTTHAQIVDLAINSDFKFSNVNFLIFKYVYEYSKNYLNIKNLIISCHPKKVSTFRKLFGFLPMTKNFFDSRLGGMPSIGMYLNLDDAYDFMAINFGKQVEAKNIFFYFTKYDFSQFFFFPSREYFVSHDPVMKPQLMNYFFNYKTSLLSDLENEQLEVLHYYYTSEEYKSIIPKVDFNITFHHMRRSRRFPVACEAQLSHNETKNIVNINSVSLHGFSLTFNKAHSLTPGDEVKLKLKVSEFSIVNLTAELIWKKNHLEYGFKILKSSLEWESYLKFLNDRFDGDQLDESSKRVA